ncbi:MAG: S-layer homology domain-containing protein, partial [Gracilibacteraceae bacterium]|nr:S-layer homology domain-containing protein [Gracilibacteraceae bacterium]
PQGEVTRAQFVKMLVEAMGYKKIDSVSFVDMKPYPTSKPHWASVYIETALRNGVIVKAEEGDRFYPDAPISRKDMVMMLFRALKLEPSDGPNPYYDLAEPNDCFTKVYEEYLVRGIPMNGKIIFNPTGVTTRAQAAVIISRMIDYKADPKGFVEKAARDERIANGTATKEDLEIIRQSEIEKAKADPNYIIEPKIRIINTRKDFEVYGEDAEWRFNLNAGYIALENYEDYDKYAPDTQYKVVCTDKDKDLINTGTLLTQPFISYDHVYEVRRDYWKTFGDGIAKNDYFDTYMLFNIKRDEEKAVNGKWTDVPDYVKKGETLNFKLYLKRGNNSREYDIKFKVN